MYAQVHAQPLPPGRRELDFDSTEDSDDVVFDLMMKKLAAFKATGEFGAEFTPDHFPIFIGFPPAGHPFPTAFSAHTE